MAEDPIRIRKQLLRAEWPKIRVDYNPEEWKETYRGYKHAPQFQESVDLLQKLEDLSEKEAEQKLLDILIKVTFIETNLTVNGKQNAKDLFENLQLAHNKQQTIPFSSPDDVASFCDSMNLIFRKEFGSNVYRNTGVESRRFVQELRKRLELGDVIDRNTYSKILAEYRETIVVKEEKNRNFVKSEFQLDFSAFFFLSKKVTGFRYDKSEKRLYLTPEASTNLTLYLPIFINTINSNHFFKMDYSRHISSFVTLGATGYPDRSAMTIIDACCYQTECAMFRQNFEKNDQTWRILMTINGRICPNSPGQSVEVFDLEQYPFSLVNNLVMKKTGRIMDAGGILLKTCFTEVENILNKQDISIKSRPLISQATD